MKAIFLLIGMALACRASVIFTVTERFDYLNPGMPSGFSLGQEVSQTFTLDGGVSPIATDSGFYYTGSITGFRLEIPNAGFAVEAGLGDILAGSDGAVLFSAYPSEPVFHEGLEFLRAETYFSISSGGGPVVDAFQSGQFEYDGFVLYFRDPSTGGDTSGSVWDWTDTGWNPDLITFPVIPEPSAALLGGLSLLGLLRRRRDLR